MKTGTQDTDRQDAGTSRRRVLIASSASALGVAGLAACGGGDGDSSSAASTTGSPATTQAPATSSSGLATQESANIKVIALDQVPEGGAIAASVSGLKLLVTRAAGGDPKVFSSVCPHQGCAVAPNGTTNLLCPCHQSTFDIATGARLGGQTPTGLPSYNSQVVDGQVVLTSTTEIPGA